MTVKEAARTSVLSRRWRKVWAFIPSLNFDTPHKLDAEVSIQVNRRTIRLVNAERLRHVNWINRVLESYQGSTIDEFRVRFDLNEDHKRDLDRWVNFASEKKVKEFVMDLQISLRTLQLKEVNVSGDGIEYLLSSCRCWSITLLEALEDKALHAFEKHIYFRDKSVVIHIFLSTSSLFWECPQPC
ncbi:F-box/LRR-repeat protein At3g58900-like [Tripterygium wilfordii]|uniref:F-box/LRR-repeat protein At3g58900-like n=1 Tax=Tripterygium wilfordii TaxID=458696 RepID=UPI0018F80006|nr:F-box/LRR-repeat protein At3g58900-like [Tripterygium wilfordii]